MSDSNVVLWQPAPFDGTDLLPVNLGATKANTIGRDNIEMQDLILPNLSILQGMSDAVTQGVEGAKPGRFWLSGAEEVLEGPLRVLICAHTKSRALFPKPERPEHANLNECFSKDGVQGSFYGDCSSCPHKVWGEQRGQAPACSESHNFTVLTTQGPAMVRFSRTSFQSARRLLTTWSMSNDALWAHPTIITARQQTKPLPNGKTATFYSMDLKWQQRETVPPHVQQAAQTIYEQIMQSHEHGRFGGSDQFKEEG
jgi:hypothetical protein